jgi:hypothetical protein
MQRIDREGANEMSKIKKKTGRGNQEMELKVRRLYV